MGDPHNSLASPNYTLLYPHHNHTHMRKHTAASTLVSPVPTPCVD